MAVSRRCQEINLSVRCIVYGMFYKMALTSRPQTPMPHLHRLHNGQMLLYVFHRPQLLPVLHMPHLILLGLYRPHLLSMLHKPHLSVVFHRLEFLLLVLQRPHVRDSNIDRRGHSARDDPICRYLLFLYCTGDNPYILYNSLYLVILYMITCTETLYM